MGSGYDSGGADNSTIIQTDEKIGNTGLTLTSVELSPVSIRVSYDADQEAQVEEVPMPTGLVLKDGTKLEGVYGGPGSSGMDGSKYICTYAFERVIDPDQVAAVLIPKNLEVGQKGRIQIIIRLPYSRVRAGSDLTVTSSSERSSEPGCGLDDPE